MTVVDVNSGADREIVFQFPEGMTPISGASIINADDAIQQRLTATLTNGTTGVVTVFFEGSAPMPSGSYGFAVQVTIPGNRTEASPMVFIRVR